VTLTEERDSSAEVKLSTDVSKSQSFKVRNVLVTYVTVVSMRVHYFVTESDIVRLMYTPVVQKYEKRSKKQLKTIGRIMNIDDSSHSMHCWLTF